MQPANWTSLRRAAVLTLCSMICSVRLVAQSEPAKPLFTWGDAALAGTFVAATFAVRPLDLRYAELLRDSATQDSRRIHRLAQFVRTVATPGSSVIGITMYATGRLAHSDRLASLGLHGTEALLLGEAMGAALKGVVGRQRPYVTPRDPQSFGLFRGFFGGDAYRSFPSGHTVAAFAAAAAVTSETASWRQGIQWIVGPVLYTGAGLTGVSRMYDNRHWASDVVVGAAIGTFAGLKVVRYHAAHPNNQVDRFFLRASLVPVGTDGHALQLSIAPAPRIELRAP